MPIERYTGVLDILGVDEFPFLAGAGLGGGSLAYGGIVIQPHAELWKTVFPSGVDYGEMEREYFPRVLSMLRASPIPDDILETEYFLGTRVLIEQCRNVGFPMLESEHSEFRDGLAKFHMAIDWEAVREEIAGSRVPSFIAAEFWYGDNSGAKPSLETSYLRMAEETGYVTIRTHHVVTDIAEAEGGEYRVSVDIISPFGKVVDRQTLTCEHLFLGAGTFGTIRLLLRANAKGDLCRLNNATGEGFGNDGDVFLVRHKLGANTNPHLGGPGCVAVLNYENPVRPVCMMRAPLPRFKQDFPNGDAMATFVFSNTDKRGRVKYDLATDSLGLDFTPESEEAALHLAALLNEGCGGEVASVTKNVTGHQLGGACMGMVCDEVGRVSGYRGLYVTDGALMPGSTTCVNPVLTIAAIAERCMDHIVAEDLRA